MVYSLLNSTVPLSTASPDRGTYCDCDTVLLLQYNTRSFVVGYDVLQPPPRPPPPLVFLAGMSRKDPRLPFASKACHRKWFCSLDINTLIISRYSVIL